jgi:hypothetical protein
MNKKKKLIGVTGRAKSGKDTVGKHLVMRHNFHRMAFADPLKDAMAATFGVAVEEFHCERLKDEIEPHWGITRRFMLQHGADALRGKFGQSLFVDRWVHGFLKVADTDHVVVTDVRYPAEAEIIRSLGGIIIDIRREESGLPGLAGKHSSEQELAETLVDSTVINNGTKEHLYAWIDIILGKEFGSD